MNAEAARLIALLDLKAHPEGGHYREMFRDAGDRAHSTAIYFLLCESEASRWHRIDAAEIWHFYRGAPLEISVGKEMHILGNTIENGERPQIVVPPHAWQAARPLGAYTLVGCTVAPGFEFSKFEMAPEGWMPD
jgi:predicted cupin superfamily sugar epimerase